VEWVVWCFCISMSLSTCKAILGHLFLFNIMMRNSPTCSRKKITSEIQNVIKH
jgi:hypothetical protein